MTRCDAIRHVLGWDPVCFLLFVVFTAIAAALYLVQMFGDNKNIYHLFGGYPDDEMAVLKARMRFTVKMLCALSALIFAFCTVGKIARAFVPSTKEMAAIVVIPRIANSQSVQDIGSGIVDLAKSWMEELKPGTKPETKGE